MAVPSTAGANKAAGVIAEDGLGASLRGITARRRVAIVAADASELVGLRGPLLKSIIARGHQVLCVTPSVDEAAVKALRGASVAHVSVPMRRGRLSALRERGSLARMRTVLADWEPNVVLGIGLKPMVLASIAARRIADARIVLIATGLNELGRGARPPFSVRWLLRRAFADAKALIVYNADDERRLRDLAVVPASLKVIVEAGAGVDLAAFSPQPMPSLESGLVFTMIAPRDPAKGIGEFIEVARRTKARFPKSRFVLALSEPDDITASQGFDVRQVPPEVELVAAIDAVSLLAATHVFVLPSRSEGFAQRVAEALACGRPAITSDIAGCREIVDERVSGVLVPPGDAVALGNAVDSFLRRPEDIAWMGQAARRKAERRFDARTINAELLDLMDIAGDAAQ